MQKHLNYILKKINDNGNTYWIITVCKNNYIYQLIETSEPEMDVLLNNDDMYKNLKRIDKCQLDFKHTSQLKDK